MKVSNMPGIVKRKSYCFWSLLLFWKPEEYFQYKDLHCWKDKDLIAVVRLFFVIPLTPLKKITCVIHNSYESVLKLRISKVGGNNFKAFPHLRNKCSDEFYLLQTCLHKNCKCSCLNSCFLYLHILNAIIYFY